MNPEKYSIAKHVFLIHPPGAGGNHLANMLSLHEDFEPRSSAFRNENELLEQYNCSLINSDIHQKTLDAPVHYSDLQNLQPKELDEHLDDILKLSKKYIFCCHDYEYEHTGKNIRLLPVEKMCIVFSAPETNMIVKNRVMTGPWSANQLEKEKYNSQYYIDKRLINQDMIFDLNTDLFFDINGFDYIQKLICDNMGIELPELGRKLHEIYIKHKVLVYGS